MTTEKLFDLGLLAITFSSFWLVFVLMVRVVISRWLGPRWAYCLWLVPLLGLLAMAIPSKPVQRALNVQAIELPVVNGVVTKAGDMINLSGNVLAEADKHLITDRQVALKSWMLRFWAFGTFLFVLIFSIRSIRASNGMYSLSSPPTDEQMSVIQTRCHDLASELSAPVRILSSNHGPAVAGLLQQTLYLPADFFQRFSPQQQVLILKHEYQHLKRHDLVALLVVCFYRSLFWFNPLVYIAEKYLRLDQELSVDEKVLATSNSETKRLYGETLVLSSQATSGFAQVSYSPGFGQLKARTLMLRHYRVRTVRTMLGGLVLATSISISMVFGTLGVLEFRPDVANLEARALGGKAGIQFAQKNYPGTISSLVEMERISPTSLTADHLALHGRALLKLKQWDQGLAYIDRAISQSESNGQSPQQNWLLVQTALEWKLGDSTAAAISLERSIQLYPETTYEDTLMLLNQLVQDVWVPIVGDDSLAQL